MFELHLYPNWHHLFQHFIALGEETCVSALVRHYFHKLPAAEARADWGVESWIGDQDSVYYAYWWAGVERLQPGSASGSQAQESWHGNVLKPSIGNLHRPMPDFTASS